MNRHTPTADPAAGRPKPYSSVRVFLHWLSALIIIWATVSGFGVALLPKGDALRQWVEALNPQVSTLFIPFFAWRFWLHLKAPKPATTAKSTQATLARVTHSVLYLLIAGVLITGVLMMTHPVILLTLIPMPQLIHSTPALAELRSVHHLLCALLAVLVILHLLAVIKHQVTGRSVLYRMR
ncbi:cytochrome b/b6 domain-containing protein [Pseudomonas sp. G.S.17]|uniref:cytochrome b n=1 Tax=Pseudomonas sp. G.S.17 TaxID=3137451 RepID=UPI00311CC831